jgi:hypothetical protein
MSGRATKTAELFFLSQHAVVLQMGVDVPQQRSPFDVDFLSLGTLPRVRGQLLHDAG